MSAGIKVTVSNPDTGAVLEEHLIEDDYVIVTAGSCHVASQDAYANGTHVLTLKGRKA